MAKITLVVDTETKALTVQVDGKSISNVRSVSAYQYRDAEGDVNGFDVSVQVEEPEVNGIRKNTTYYAMGSKHIADIQRGEAKTHDDLASFVGETDFSKAQQDILEYFTQKRNRGV